MHPVPSIGLALALEHERDVKTRAGRAALDRDAALAAGQAAPAARQAAPDTLVVRPARPGDARALSVLAVLDDASSEAGRLAAAARAGEDPALVAEERGAVVAALDVSRGLLVADPFRKTSEAAELLRLRARQLQGGEAPRRLGLRTALRSRLRPRTG